MGHHRQIIDRSGGRRLCLYSREPAAISILTVCLRGRQRITASAPPSIIGDWIGIAAARQGRTFLPNQAECPFFVSCTMVDQ